MNGIGRPKEKGSKYGQFPQKKVKWSSADRLSFQLILDDCQTPNALLQGTHWYFLARPTEKIAWVALFARR